MPIQSLKEPLILVMKKNARVLGNLVEWLKTKNKDPSGRISGTPMLLIDDEADNASVNTSANADSPTSCRRRLNFDPPCRLNFDPGMEAGIVDADCV